MVESLDKLGKRIENIDFLITEEYRYALKYNKQREMLSYLSYGLKTQKTKDNSTKQQRKEDKLFEKLRKLSEDHSPTRHSDHRDADG